MTAKMFAGGFKTRNGFKTGLLISQLAPPKSFSEHKSPKQIKILTQNIWCSYFAGGKNTNERIDVLTNHLSNDLPDIICFQECFIFGLGAFVYGNKFSYLHQKMLNLGYIYFNNPIITLPYFGQNNGLIIYSKYKLINKLSINNQFNKCRLLSKKGYTIDTVQFDNNKVMRTKCFVCRRVLKVLMQDI